MGKGILAAVNFRQLDLNLLRVLCAVHRTGSVTEAAHRLALSQPATSNALTRLRRYFDDRLFVRSPRGLHPTPLAQRLAPLVAAHLDALEAAFAIGDEFDPATHAVHWRLSLSDLGETLFLPPLAHVLRALAPRCRLSNESVAVSEVSSALGERKIDLAIGILEPLHRGIDNEVLLQESFVGITGQRWPLAHAPEDATLTMAQLERAPLAVASPTATAHGLVDTWLQHTKLTEHIVVEARHYVPLPALVLHSDLLAIVPAMWARAALRQYPVRVWALPGRPPRYQVSMAWHESAGTGAAHGWLRARVRELFQHG